MKWDTWNSLEYDAQLADTLTQIAGSRLVAAILAARGIKTPDEAGQFLSADISQLQDPMELKDIQKGVSRVRQAIDRRETVAVFGDYDVDGITSSALMTEYLISKGLAPQVYIPDRLEEGYGLNTGAIAHLGEGGVSLIITVDCGITAVEETEYARSLGIDMVITDHHECQAVLPGAVAVIDPKRPDCPYPDKELAGVGVAFKFICALEGREQTRTLLDKYSDLVAVGTVADVMNLTGENRALVAEGLVAIRSSRRIGLASLCRESGVEPERVTAQSISYGLAPRLNAAGRMGESNLAFSLLCTREPGEAEELGKRLCALNRERQAVEREILDSALSLLEHEGYEKGPIILASDSWHRGVVGIVASRLAERYHEPVLMLSIDENGEAKGSCRSARGFDLFLALSSCSGLLDNFGGHPQAAGLTVSEKSLERFKADFGVYYSEHPPAEAGDALETDLTLEDPGLLTLDEIRSLDKLEPCGKGNPSPVLILENVRLHRVQSIGGGQHLRLQAEKWGRVYDCVFFSATPDTLGAQEGGRVDIAFTPQVNTFRGNTSVQLLVKDICPSSRRLVERAKRVWTDLCTGELPPAREAASLRPVRDDFVRLWKCLLPRDSVSGRPETVLGSLVEESRGGNEAKYYICLKVMDELGLARVDEQTDELDIEINRQAGKVDLDSSKALTALKRAMG